MSSSFPKATDYCHFTDQRDHILSCPDMYVSSTQQIPYIGYTLKFDENVRKIIETRISIPQAVERLFLEILSNATDNIDRSRRNNIQPPPIQIFMDRQTINIINGGVPIPIERHPDYNMYVPELIFGTLLSSSNYDKSVARTGAGVNGLGAKLTNIFSNRFIVDIGDSNRHLRYQQQWNSHMKVHSEPKITKYNGPSYVSITYDLDFKYFGYPEPISNQTTGGYPPEAFYLFAYHGANASFSSKIDVIFNNMPFNYTKIQDYAQLYFGTDLGKYITYNENNKIELCLIDTPDNGKCVSFVNSMITKDGGIHVKHIYKEISNFVIGTFEHIKYKDEAERDTIKKLLKSNDIIPHVSIIVSCQVNNPKFSGQMKNYLTGPSLGISIPEKLLKQMLSWDLIDRLYATIDAKQFKTLSKTDGRKVRHTSILKGEDANLAGTSNSGRCTLFVTEGKSAMSYAVKLISKIPEGRNFFGVYPMQGKPLNVMNAPPFQIAENTEICNLKQMLGLREGVDYTNETNFKTLRYGNFIILADSDCDGKHIIGLVLNFFFCRYRSLLTIGYVMYLRTPIIRGWNDNKTIKFYTSTEYENWEKQMGNNLNKWSFHYYKGLATSTDSDIDDEYNNLKIVQCIYDNSSEDSFKLAFNDKLSNQRKEWISKYQQHTGLELIQSQPISQFINYEFIEYSLVNISRSIPRMLDGLKESQRKVVWGALLKWKKSGSMQWSKKIITGKVEKYKVARFSAFISQETGYHHGEKCLSDTIISMTQNFIGSNNLPFFREDGQFGTRNMGGDDAGDPRYIYTRPAWWIPYIFRNEDIPILKHVIDEQKILEPITLIPIIPVALINGCSGIGTGYSTYIPPFNPIDICNWLKCKINQQPLPNLIPWFKGFTGSISVKERIRVNHNQPEDDILGSDHEYPNDIPSSFTLVTTGKYSIEDNNVVITELPIGRWIHKYKEWLDHLLTEKQITEYSNLSTHEYPKFIISGFPSPSNNNLRLCKSFGLSNMVLLDIDNHPVRYNDVNMILETFYQQRLPYYQMRKDNIIEGLTNKINSINNKIKLITLVVSGEIIIMNQSRNVIMTQVQSYDLPCDVIKGVSLINCTLEGIDELNKERDILMEQRHKYQECQCKDLWLQDIDEFLEMLIKINTEQEKIDKKNQSKLNTTTTIKRTRTRKVPTKNK